MGPRRIELSDSLKAKIAEVDAELRKLLYGEKGYPVWGTKFTEIEAVAMSVGEELSRRMMAASAGQQQGELPSEALMCEEEQARLVGTEERSLETEAGPIRYQTPKAYLPKSRRAFFPSGDGSGDRHP